MSVHETAKIHDSATIGSYCVIGANVEIGEQCVIGHGVIIHDAVAIVVDSIAYFRSGRMDAWIGVIAVVLGNDTV